MHHNLNMRVCNLFSSSKAATFSLGSLSPKALLVTQFVNGTPESLSREYLTQFREAQRLSRQEQLVMYGLYAVLLIIQKSYDINYIVTVCPANVSAKVVEAPEKLSVVAQCTLLDCMYLGSRMFCNLYAECHPTE